MSYKLIGSIGIAIFLFVVLLILAILIGDNSTNKYLHLTVILFGACGGWLLGTLISPYDKKEKEQFSIYAKAISVFLSGYLIAKFDKAATAIFESGNIFDAQFGFRVLAFFISFILAMLITFLFRHYA